MSFPTKDERAKCWGSRDKYWECLDQNGDESQCKVFRKLYEENCSGQWVKHFDRRRNYLIFKEKIEKHGYEPTDDNKS
ncbi:cytochrome c oxidase assembly factor 6 homolog [Anthonomus grandis grandis]|uniref:cytochrome c oxidase assembly factor 6 homolog n=1 Tax=Anthonomus grandis grandis TaxID=2921223 RepID=UPI0021657244|nr:cytochrome c oxidase assembly factor 6 homolog [Anthonomus grandis grandis]